MTEQNSTGLESSKEAGGSERESFSTQVVQDLSQWATPGQDGVPQHLEGRWQEYLKTIQYPALRWGVSHLPDLASWEDLTPCQRTRERMSRLMPTLRAEAQQALSRDKRDHGKAKTTAFQANSSSTEVQRRRFRQFRYQEGEGPREVCSRLRELCHHWLEPEGRTKEQILELLVLEQFLVILPQAIQNRVRGRGPETCAQAVALAEGFLLRQQESLQSEPQTTTVTLSEGQQPASEVRQRPLAKEGRQQGHGKNNLLGSLPRLGNSSRERAHAYPFSTALSPSSLRQPEDEKMPSDGLVPPTSP